MSEVVLVAGAGALEDAIEAVSEEDGYKTDRESEVNPTTGSHGVGGEVEGGLIVRS